MEEHYKRKMGYAHYDRFLMEFEKELSENAFEKGQGKEASEVFIE